MLRAGVLRAPLHMWQPTISTLNSPTLLIAYLYIHMVLRDVQTQLLQAAGASERDGGSMGCYEAHDESLDVPICSGSQSPSHPGRSVLRESFFVGISIVLVPFTPGTPFFRRLVRFLVVVKAVRGVTASLAPLVFLV